MALSALTDRSRIPDEEALSSVLGPAVRVWRELRDHVEATWPPVEAEWSHAGFKYGWSLRLRHKGRVIVYLTPGSGCFAVGVVLGDRAIAAAKAARLPAAVVALIDQAPRYAEGTGVRIEVRRSSQIAAVRKLLAAKMAPSPR